jgi:flagellar biosynthesis component FlhA
MAKDKKEKSKKNFTKALLPWIIVAIMIYTIAAFILQFFTQTEISTTLTTCYYGFWTVEIISLAGIKATKVRKNKNDNEDV